MWLEANDEVMAKMREELNEDPQRMENHVRLVAEWIASKPYMPQNYDKALLTTFLRFSKQDLQRTKKRLEAFFALVTYHKPVFVNIQSEFERHIANFRTLYDVYVPPELTPDGYRLTIFKVTPNAAKEGFSLDALKLFHFTECLKFFHAPCRLGDEYVLDVTHFSAAMLPRVPTASLLHLFTHFQNTYPVRYRRIIYTSMNAVMGQLLNIIKPVFGRKLRDRMIHRSDSDLSDLYPRAMLPQDFGGERAPIDRLTDGYVTILRANADRIAAMEQCKLSGTIPEEYKCRFDGGFGIDGSFRKLDLD